MRGCICRLKIILPHISKIPFDGSTIEMPRADKAPSAGALSGQVSELHRKGIAPVAGKVDEDILGLCELKDAGFPPHAAIA